MPERRRYHPLTFFPAATITSSGATSSIDLGDYQEITIWMKVSAVTGAGTLDVKLQVSDNNDDWADHTSFTQIAAVSTTLGKVSGNIGRYCRLYYTLAGFTDLTFSLTGIAKT